MHKNVTQKYIQQPNANRNMIIIVCCPLLGNVESQITQEGLKMEIDNVDAYQYSLKNIECDIPNNIDYMYDQKIRRSPNPYRFISDRHTILSSNIANGHKSVAYWNRIRSRTWNIVSNPIQVEIIFILILIF